MGINWVTFIAQIVNLCVLIWLLKRFLYKPILNAVDKRQAEILDKVNRATQEYESAKADHLALEKQRADFEKERQNLFAQTTKEVARLKKEQLTELADLKEKMVAKIQSDLIKDKDLTTLKMRDAAAQQFMLMAEKLIQNFGSISPAEQAANLFKNQLNTLTKTQLKALMTAVQKQSGLILLQAQNMPPDRQKDLHKFIKQKLGLTDRTQIETVIDETLILGFELHVGDTVIEWSLKSFSEELRNNMNIALSEISSAK